MPPFDMFRYDYCYPASGADAAVMSRAARQQSGYHKATVERLAEVGRARVEGRWRSFGVRIEPEVEP